MYNNAFDHEFLNMNIQILKNLIEYHSTFCEYYFFEQHLNDTVDIVFFLSIYYDCMKYIAIIKLSTDTTKEADALINQLRMQCGRSM